MQENFYDTLIKEIKVLIENKKLDEAEGLIVDELSQVYLPLEIEKELNDLNDEILALRPEKEIRPLPISLIEKLLEANDDLTIYAALALNEYNLNNHLQLVEKYLINNPSVEAASLLIEACIKQGILKELLYNKGGISYNFIPAYIQLPLESDGYLKAHELLHNWLEDLNPSLLKLTLEKLVETVYFHLPESFEEIEGELLAMKVLKEVSSLLADNQILLDITAKYKVDFSKQLT